MALITNIVSAWKFDESSGNPVDSTGNGWTLTNNGTTWFVAGKLNNCADFWTANTTKYFSTANALIDTSTTWSSTIAGWVNISTALASWVDYYLFWSVKNLWRQFEYKYSNIWGTLCLNLTVFDWSSGIVYQQNTTLTVWTWYFISWTVSGNTISTYLNGSQLGTNQTITNVLNGTTTNTVSVWRHPNASAGFSSSKADESWIWSRVLSAWEILQLYNSGNILSYPFSTGILSWPAFLLNFL